MQQKHHITDQSAHRAAQADLAAARLNQGPPGRNQSAVTLKGRALSQECFLNSNGKLARKVERSGGQTHEYAYAYDARGRLASVTRNGDLVEEYSYNQSGQRTWQRRAYAHSRANGAWRFSYDAQGRLIKCARADLASGPSAAAGTEVNPQYANFSPGSQLSEPSVPAPEVSFTYDSRGALAARRDSGGVTRFVYGQDTRLDKILLPSGVEISYAYSAANPLGPARRYKNGVLTAEFTWSSPLRLAACRDHEHLLEYTFAYADSGTLSKVRLAAFKPAQAKAAPEVDWVADSAKWTEGLTSGSGSPQPQASRPDIDWVADSAFWLEDHAERLSQNHLHDLLASHGGLPLNLFCDCDQTGTPRMFTDASGQVVKELLSDSFGQPLSDSFPALFMPIAFAGGLADPATGLIGFGYRDYDPALGRFTAPDPARDLRGDGDLYDYCMDDPVSNVDPLGLESWPLSFLAKIQQHGQESLAPGTYWGTAGEQASAGRSFDPLRQTSSGEQQRIFTSLTSEPREGTGAQPFTLQTQEGSRFTNENLAAGGLPAVDSTAQPVAQHGNMEVTLKYLREHVEPGSKSKCAKYVGNALKAGGFRWNVSLSTAGDSADGYGPVLEDNGYRAMPAGTAPQAGDIVIFPRLTKEGHGHMAMFDGKAWFSDFAQNDMSGGEKYSKAPYTLYRYFQP